jgi:hypothetical protein
MKAKVFDGIGSMSHGRVVRIKFELDFFVDRDEEYQTIEDLTIEQAKLLVRRNSRITLGDKVLVALKNADVVTV